MKRLLPLLYISSLAIVLVACNDNKEKGFEVQSPKNRTVVEYIVADGDLYPSAAEYINDLEYNWSGSSSEYRVVYLYPAAKNTDYTSGIANYNENPRLLLITHDTDRSRINSTVIKQYSRSQNPNDPAVKQQILDDALYFLPSEYHTFTEWANSISLVNRTVIHYLIADNNLYPYAEQNINEMESVWNPVYDGKMIVYLHPVSKTSSYAYLSTQQVYDETPRLMLIGKDNDTREMTSLILKTYPRTQNPCDPEVMRAVLADAMELAPARRYGLNMWSHGSGWLPGNSSSPLKSLTGSPESYAPQTMPSKLDRDVVMQRYGDGQISYSYGGSNSFSNDVIDIDEMAAALPDVKFDFIMFDGCLMSCVEVAYELKDKCDYLIASAAEILVGGFPYPDIVGYMMENEVNLTGIAQAFYDFYNPRSAATISVIDQSKLDNLAVQVKRLVDGGITGTLTATQQFGRRASSSSMGYLNVFYDFAQLIRNTWSGSDLSDFENALDAAIYYQDASMPRLFPSSNYPINVTTHSGLSSYLPRASETETLSFYRNRMAWSAASGMGTLVP